MRIGLARQPTEVCTTAIRVMLIWSWGSLAWASPGHNLPLDQQWVPHDPVPLALAPQIANPNDQFANPDNQFRSTSHISAAHQGSQSRNSDQLDQLRSSAAPLSAMSRPEAISSPSHFSSELATNTRKSIADSSRSGADSLQPITIASSDREQSPADRLNLDPSIINNSPVLQRWLQQIPDVADEISTRPSFRTRLRIGYAQFPSTNQLSGWGVGIEDLWLFPGNTTFSALYQTSFDNTRQTWGFDLNYYLRPAGRYFNVAPVVGYRDINTPLYAAEGLNLGLRFMVVLSRGGGADLTLTQSWTAPGSNQEIGLTTFSIGYALTPKLRLATEIQNQNAPQRRDSRFGILMEWLL